MPGDEYSQKNALTEEMVPSHPDADLPGIGLWSAKGNSKTVDQAGGSRGEPRGPGAIRVDSYPLWEGTHNRVLP